VHLCFRSIVTKYNGSLEAALAFLTSLDTTWLNVYERPIKLPSSDHLRAGCIASISAIRLSSANVFELYEESLLQNVIIRLEFKYHT